MATFSFTRKEIMTNVKVLREVFVVVQCQLPKVNQACLAEQFRKLESWESFRNELGKVLANSGLAVTTSPDEVTIEIPEELMIANSRRYGILAVRYMPKIIAVKKAMTALFGLLENMFSKDEIRGLKREQRILDAFEKNYCAMVSENVVVDSRDAFSRETAPLYAVTKGIWDDEVVSQVINWERTKVSSHEALHDRLLAYFMKDNAK